jgi:ABC-type cobalamin/Fe3+-siderophores transport system ATPase subunit
MAEAAATTTDPGSAGKSEDITCVIVLGMAGSGKTTLVQVMFD